MNTREVFRWTDVGEKADQIHVDRERPRIGAVGKWGFRNGKTYV